MARKFDPPIPEPPEETTTGVFPPRESPEATVTLLSNSDSASAGDLKRANDRRRAELLHRSFVIEATPPSRLGKAGPYYLAAELASGGMGTVYLALRSLRGGCSEVAVKRIHRHLSGDKSFIAMFNDEAKLASSINHPYVCRVFDFGNDDGRYYLAMEYLRGAPLSQLSAAFADARLSTRRHSAIIARIIANLAEGLHAAHTLKDQTGCLLDVVHRDVSPQNLFVLCDGTVRVTDFGVARARARKHQTDGTRLKGKLAYVAPEQLAGRTMDLRVDIWGLGVVAWELLTGQPLFSGECEADLVIAVVNRAIAPPSSLQPAVPSELSAIVMKALMRDPRDRYGSARDMARALERFLVSDPVSHTDVAEWFEQLMPDVARQSEALVRRAHAEVKVDAAPNSYREPAKAVASTRPSEAQSSDEPRAGRRRWWLGLLMAPLLLGVCAVVPYIKARRLAVHDASAHTARLAMHDAWILGGSARTKPSTPRPRLRDRDRY